MAFCLQKRNNQSEDCFLTSPAFFASQSQIHASRSVCDNGVKRLFHLIEWFGMERPKFLGSTKVCLLPPVGNVAEGFLGTSVKKAGGEI